MSPGKHRKWHFRAFGACTKFYSCVHYGKCSLRPCSLHFTTQWLGKYCSIKLIKYWYFLIYLILINQSDDVKSLSLPGTYHEKITSMGNSLRSFTRLKHLDVSRNALTSSEVCTAPNLHMKPKTGLRNENNLGRILLGLFQNENARNWQ